MATGAVHELIHARELLDQLRSAATFTQYERAFYGCIIALRKSRYQFHKMTRKRLAAPAAQPGSKSTPQQRSFETWWRRQEKDPLMEWVKKVRDDDQHYNQGHLGFEAFVELLRPEDFDVSPEAQLIVTEGQPYFVWDYFSVRERHQLAEPRPGTPTAKARNSVAFAISEPPTMHRGEPLSTSDPVKLCELSLLHIEWLMEEAEARWPRTAPDFFNSLRSSGVGVWEEGSAAP